MSDKLKSSMSLSPDAEPTATRSTVPIWIIVLTLMLLFLGMVYFDHHGGWFDSQVYAPYATAEQLEAYQPKSGAAALLASAMAWMVWVKPRRPRRWPALNGSTPRDSIVSSASRSPG